MKELLKNQTGAIIVAIIIVLVLATAGGGVAFLTVRMVVSGDGNFLKPFEELGWIEVASDDDKSEDKNTEKEDKVKENDNTDDEEENKDKKTDKNKKDKDNADEDKSNKEDSDKDSSKKDDKKTSSKNKKTEYLVDNSRLSSQSKKSGVEHYYGELSLGDEIDSSGEYAELYKLLKAGVNLYAKDGKVIEIEFGFDIKDFCEEAFKQAPEEFKASGMTSSKELQEMMMSMIETMFDTFDEEYSDYISKYSEDGVFQLYVTEKGFESLYETYNIKEGENDVDIFIKALEESFKNKIEIVKD